jgi:hypothetical protein
MTFEDARRFLFTLYASGKRSSEGQAGRFGVGFWSVLRFQPSRISIRSCPAGSKDAWEIDLDEHLSLSPKRSSRLAQGTEVILERRATGEDVEDSVFSSAFRDARFLVQRDQPSAAVEISVNGKKVTREFALPAPSIRFGRRGVRGVVALGSVGRVDLYSFGLRVRTVEVLDDLLQEQARKEPRTKIAEGLMPQVMLDSEHLDVLLARGDTREDRELRRLVTIAQQELRRLVETQLDCKGTGSTLARLRRRLVRSIRRSRNAILLAGVVMTLAALSVSIDWFLSRTESSVQPRQTGESWVVEQAALQRTSYRDLKTLYRGPTVNNLVQRETAIDLSYEPADMSFLFGALRFSSLESLHRENGEWRAADRDLELEDECVDIHLATDAEAGIVRLPVPPGFSVVAAREADGQGGLPIVRSSSGEEGAVLESRIEGSVEYRACLAAAVRGRSNRSTWPQLPESFLSDLEVLSGASIQERVSRALQAVSRVVAYDRSQNTAHQYRLAAERGEPLIESAFRIGLGDCDVQNAILASTLDHLGVEARLAVGYVGFLGTVLTGLHAWVEYRDEIGFWSVADASTVDDNAVNVTAAPRYSSTQPHSVEPVSAALKPRTEPKAFYGVIAAVLGLGGAVVAWVIVSGRSRTAFPGEVNTPALVRGALERPEVYESIPAVFDDPLVPCVGGRTISLAAVRRSSRRGKLFCGRRESRAADRVAARGYPVIVRDHPVGRIVSDLLSAVDLDRLSMLLAAGQKPRACESVNQHMAILHMPWEVVVASGVDEESIVVPTGLLGLRNQENHRTIVVGAESQLAREVERLEESQLGEAALLLADCLTMSVDGLRRFRDLILPALAREVFETESEPS